MKNLETLRKRAWAKTWQISLAMFLLSFAISYYFMPNQLPLIAGITLFTTIISAVIPLVFFYKKVNLEYKEKFVAPMMSRYLPKLSYYPKQYISKDLFKKSGLFESFTTYTGDDYMESDIDGATLSFSELNVSRTTSTGKSTTTTPVFMGLFIVIHLKEDPNISFTMKPDNLERWFGKLGRKLKPRQTKSGTLIETGNKQFDKRYKIRGNTPEKAKQIFDSTFTNRVLDIYQELKTAKYPKTKGSFNHDLWMSIQDDRFYIAFGGVQLFKIPFWKSVEKNTKKFNQNIELIKTALKTSANIMNQFQV